jgi:hypothetical protein
MFLYPYKMASASAKAIQNNINGHAGERMVVRVKEDSMMNPRRRRPVVNWGNSNMPNWTWQLGRDLNHPEAVARASNKIETFSTLANTLSAYLVGWTTIRELASEWLTAGHSVVVRHNVQSHSGRGIEIIEPGQALPPAPLYTCYKKKRSEYRVHIFRGDMIDIQEKRAQRDFERTSLQAKVRSHDNGWIFCRDNIEVDRGRISHLATRAINALGLDFGAVDIIYNEREDSFYILEVNTAVGLEGETLETYTAALVSYVGSLA